MNCRWGYTGQFMKCVVKANGGRILDEEICAHGEVKQTAEFLNVDFVWPSGSKTVISISKSSFNIDGASANRRVEGTDTVCMQTEETKTGSERLSLSENDKSIFLSDHITPYDNRVKCD